MWAAEVLTWTKYSTSCFWNEWLAVETELSVSTDHPVTHLQWTAEFDFLPEKLSLLQRNIETEPGSDWSICSILKNNASRKLKFTAVDVSWRWWKAELFTRPNVCKWNQGTSAPQQRKCKVASCSSIPKIPTVYLKGQNKRENSTLLQG